MQTPAGARSGSLTQPSAARSAHVATTGRWELPRVSRRVWITALTTVLLALGVAATIPAVPGIYFVLISPRGRTGVEVFLALNELFAALVLFLFSESALHDRLRWVSLGLLVLGVSGLLFGGLLPVDGDDGTRLNMAMMASLVARIIGTACIAVGLALPRPPCLRRARAAGILGAYAVLSTLLLAAPAHLPRLSRWADLNALQVTAQTSDSVLPGLTAWHYALSLVPLSLAILAAIGVTRSVPAAPLGDWLLLAMVLLASSELDTLLWPSAYSSILTMATVLRLAFTAALAVGAIIALNRISTRRAAMLASERELSARLTDLATLRANFSAMVAHELTSPLGAIRRSADLLSLDLPATMRDQAVQTIQTETDLLHRLVADVESASAIEREDFTVQLRPVPVDSLVAEAVAFAGTLAGARDWRIDHAAHVLVLADSVRLSQVLHNLLGNAAKFSPPGSPVELRTRQRGDRVRFEVIDAGPGIPPDDVRRVFEKFGRGRDAVGRRVPGMGLGLYLSRRIVRSHGGDLTVISPPGGGAAFAFELRIAR